MLRKAVSMCIPTIFRPSSLSACMHWQGLQQGFVDSACTYCSYFYNPSAWHLTHNVILTLVLSYTRTGVECFQSRCRHCASRCNNFILQDSRSFNLKVTHKKQACRPSLGQRVQWPYTLHDELAISLSNNIEQY